MLSLGLIPVGHLPAHTLPILSVIAEACAPSMEDFGLLVQVDYDITAFTSPAYQRGSLLDPIRKSHLEDGFALRCFQRLS